MKSTAVLLLAACLLVTATSHRATADEPTTQPWNPADLRMAEKMNVQMRTRSLPVVKSAPLNDVLRFAIENQDLTIRTKLPATNGPSRVELPELSGITTINIQDAPDRLAQSRRLFYQLMYYNFDRPDSIQIITTVFQGPGNLQVAQDSDLLTEERTVQLIQQPFAPDGVPVEGEEPVRLFIKIINKTTNEETDLRLGAANFVELRRKYPSETTQYLQPIFRDLKQEAGAFAIDANAAWQVLAARSPAGDPKIVAKVDELVAGLDSDQFHDRQAAQDGLAKLGQPAAMVLMGKSRAALSIQQNTEIDAFLTPYLPLDRQLAEQLRTEPNFLIDTLYSDDALLRAAAIEEFRSLKNEKIDFDVNAPPETRYPAIEELRRKYIPTTKPSAQ